MKLRHMGATLALGLNALTLTGQIDAAISQDIHTSRHQDKHLSPTLITHHLTTVTDTFHFDHTSLDTIPVIDLPGYTFWVSTEGFHLQNTLGETISYRLEGKIKTLWMTSRPDLSVWGMEKISDEKWHIVLKPPLLEARNEVLMTHHFADIIHLAMTGIASFEQKAHAGTSKEQTIKFVRMDTKIKPHE